MPPMSMTANTLELLKKHRLKRKLMRNVSVRTVLMSDHYDSLDEDWGTASMTVMERLVEADRPSTAADTTKSDKAAPPSRRSSSSDAESPSASTAQKRPTYVKSNSADAVMEHKGDKFHSSESPTTSPRKLNKASPPKLAPCANDFSPSRRSPRSPSRRSREMTGNDLPKTILFGENDPRDEPAAAPTEVENTVKLSFSNEENLTPEKRNLPSHRTGGAETSCADLDKPTTDVEGTTAPLDVEETVKFSMPRQRALASEAQKPLGPSDRIEQPEPLKVSATVDDVRAASPDSVATPLSVDAPPSLEDELSAKQSNSPGGHSSLSSASAEQHVSSPSPALPIAGVVEVPDPTAVKATATPKQKASVGGMSVSATSVFDMDEVPRTPKTLVGGPRMSRTRALAAAWERPLLSRTGAFDAEDMPLTSPVQAKPVATPPTNGKASFAAMKLRALASGGAPQPPQTAALDAPAVRTKSPAQASRPSPSAPRNLISGAKDIPEDSLKSTPAAAPTPSQMRTFNVDEVPQAPSLTASSPLQSPTTQPPAASPPRTPTFDVDEVPRTPSLMSEDQSEPAQPAPPIEAGAFDADEVPQAPSELLAALTDWAAAPDNKTARKQAKRAVEAHKAKLLSDAIKAKKDAMKTQQLAAAKAKKEAAEKARRVAEEKAKKVAEASEKVKKEAAAKKAKDLLEWAREARAKAKAREKRAEEEKAAAREKEAAEERKAATKEKEAAEEEKAAATEKEAAEEEKAAATEKEAAEEEKAAATEKEAAEEEKAAATEKEAAEEEKAAASASGVALPVPETPKLESPPVKQTDTASTELKAAPPEAPPKKKEAGRRIRFADEVGRPLQETHYTVTQYSEEDLQTLRTIVLLMSPKQRKFEFIHLAYGMDEKTIVGDIIRQFAAFATDTTLAKQKYVGLCRPKEGGRELINTVSIQGYFLARDEVLVAVAKEYTAKALLKMAKPLLENKKILRAVKKAKANGLAVQRLKPSDSGPKNQPMEKRRKELEKKEASAFSKKIKVAPEPNRSSSQRRRNTPIDLDEIADDEMPNMDMSHMDSSNFMQEDTNKDKMVVTRFLNAGIFAAFAFALGSKSKPVNAH